MKDWDYLGLACGEQVNQRRLYNVFLVNILRCVNTVRGIFQDLWAPGCHIIKELVFMLCFCYTKLQV